MLTSRVFLALVVLVMCGLAVTAQVSELADYQLSQGGFVEEGRNTASAKATFEAIFSAVILGQKHQIDAGAAARFLISLKNDDSGFGSVEGADSDVFSTRYAVHALALLDGSVEKVPNPSAIIAYLHSLYDSGDGRFAADLKSAPSLLATAAAVRVFEILGESQSPFLKKDVYPGLHSHLENSVVDDWFVVDESLDPLESNFLGTYLAVKSGFKVPSGMVERLSALQDREETGGFSHYNTENIEVSSESTAAALRTLALLTDNVAKELDNDKLLIFATRHVQSKSMEENFHSAEMIAFSGLMDTMYSDLMQTLFQGATGPVSGDFVEGTPFRPACRIVLGNTVDSGFEVDILVDYPTYTGRSTSTYTLKWIGEQSLAYVSADTVSLLDLGQHSFTFQARKHIFELGTITVDKIVEKKVGYNMVVSPQVTTAGAAVSEGGTVTADTAFAFEIKLTNNRDEPVGTKADSTVNMSIRDSTGAMLGRSTEDISTEEYESISFEWAIREAALPPGPLIFTFDVTHAEAGQHTVTTREYVYDAKVVASEVVFEGAADVPSFKLGDSVALTMVPAFLDKDGNSVPLAHEVQGVDVASQRKFELELTTPAGEVIKRVVGKSVGSQSKYRFTFDVDSTLEFATAPLLEFAVRTETGNSIRLQQGESIEESLGQRLPVRTQLYVSDLTKTVTEEELPYGSEIQFQFTVTDAVTNTKVTSSNPNVANIHVQLSHIPSGDKLRVVTGHSPAKFRTGSFRIRWAVDANSLKGPASLSLALYSADTRVSELFKSASSQEKFQVSVTVVGSISLESVEYTTVDSFNRKSAFSTQFKLKGPGGKNLKGASLKANVGLKESSGNIKPVLSNLPVAYNSEALYQVSWSMKHDEAVSGEYVLELFRTDGLDQVEGAAAEASYAISLKHTRISSDDGPANWPSKIIAVFVVALFVIVRYVNPQKRLIKA